MTQNNTPQELLFMLDASVDCIKLLNLDGTIKLMNRSGCLALGVPVGGPFGMEWITLLPPKVRQAGRRALKRCIAGKPSSFSGVSAIPGESVIYWDNILTPIVGEDGKTTGILCLSRNITSQLKAEKKLRFNSNHDALTELANRRVLYRAADKFFRLESEGNRLGCIIIDVDHFKGINDFYGHDAGDAALRHVAKALKKISEPNLVTARLGGDEFAVIFFRNETRTLEQIEYRLREEIATSFLYRKRKIALTFSLGGAYTSNKITNREDLFTAADLALYSAKESGRSKMCIFSDNSNTPRSIPRRPKGTANRATV